MSHKHTTHFDDCGCKSASAQSREAALLDLVRRMKYRLVHALDCYGVGTGQPDACTCGTKELLSEAAKRLASDEGTSARVLEGKQ